MLKQQRIIALATVAAGACAVHAPAQEPELRTVIVGEDPVLIMPNSDPGLALDRSFGGVDVEISTDRGTRTYRATYGGRTHTAYADLSGPPRHLAFDLNQRRFRELMPTVSVTLRDDGDLDPVALEHNAAWAKAYPRLGFALIGLAPEADPAEVAERLGADPRVRGARLHFEDGRRRPLARPDTYEPRNGGGPLLANAKDSLTADLFVIPRMDIAQPNFTVNLAVYNWGGEQSDIGTFRTRLFKLVPDETTADGGDWTFLSELDDDEFLPVIDSKGAPFQSTKVFRHGELDPSSTYYILFFALGDVIPDADTEVLGWGYTGFTLDSLNRIQHVCMEPGRGSMPGVPDPLFPEQWHLGNVGQTGHSARGGAPGEDMRMEGALRVGRDGRGVRVAVVDTGLEVCHPDLRESIEEGASFNFNALSALSSPLLSEWAYRIESTDPFNFDPTSGHGTSVAGLIAAAADNGIGGRGVAPGVQLRGYNMLNAPRTSQLSALIESLGASDFFPDSTDVDIFNMSFGGGSRPSRPDVISEQVLTHGVRQLRSGRGAVYVLAAGNGFRSCRSLERELNSDIGCISSIGESDANLPYTIVVGAYNADGKKADYSSAGANIWISAPAGRDGIDEPALITTDQMGRERGEPAFLSALGVDVPLDGDTALNPHGDYTTMMAGTSAATPMVSGAAALLLEESPELTWRDVKHVLAATARRIDPDIEPVSATFGSGTRTVRMPWTVNAAGYAHHNWYGFGAVDIDAAVELASHYPPDSLGRFRQSGWFETATAVEVPDNDGAGVTQTVNVGGLAEDANIEAVVLELDVRHPFPNDLGVHLVSPHGTRSVISQVFNETLAVRDMAILRLHLLSNAFYGEAPNGNWQIEVFDAAEEDVGHLDAWRLRFYYGDHP